MMTMAVGRAVAGQLVRHREACSGVTVTRLPRTALAKLACGLYSTLLCSSQQGSGLQLCV
jgi:hypothetical protein